MDITLTWHEMADQNNPSWYSHHFGRGASACQIHQRGVDRWMGMIMFGNQHQSSLAEAQVWCEQQVVRIARRLFTIPEPISLEWDEERLDLWMAIIAGFKPILTPIRCSVLDEQPNGFRPSVHYFSRPVPLRSLEEAQAWCAREVLLNEDQQP